MMPKHTRSAVLKEFEAIYRTFNILNEQQQKAKGLLTTAAPYSVPYFYALGVMVHNTTLVKALERRLTTLKNTTPQRLLQSLDAELIAIEQRYNVTTTHPQIDVQGAVRAD